jgi:hypothetical protein
VVGGGATVVAVPQGGPVEVSGSDSTGFTVENLGSTRSSGACWAPRALR